MRMPDTVAGSEARWLSALAIVPVVAIPARNEAARITNCLLALARQTRRPDGVVLLLNNCTDATEAIARRLASHLPYRLHVVCHTFPPALANAGNARRLAMRYAADLAAGDGVLLTTDADTIVADDWVERNLRAIHAGAEVVCGRVVIDPVEAALIPAHLHADDARERELAAMLDAIACLLDPDLADPWPRHTEAAGASLAVTYAAFMRVGGIPAVAAGEDRAFVRALARIDAPIRHDPSIQVITSGRLIGRAPGGMADTISRRMRKQDEFADDTLEPAANAYRRIDFRRRARVAWQQRPLGRLAPRELSADLGIADAALQSILDTSCFGAAWAEIEAQSPYLLRRRVRFAELPREIAYARQLLELHVDTPRVRPRLAMMSGLGNVAIEQEHHRNSLDR